MKNKKNAMRMTILLFNILLICVLAKVSNFGFALTLIKVLTVSTVSILVVTLLLMLAVLIGTYLFHKKM